MWDAPTDSSRGPPRTCWSKRTPFQMALILILTVAIPVFIALIILYILYGCVWHKAEKCEKLCGLVTKWRDYRPDQYYTDYPDYKGTFVESDIYKFECNRPELCTHPEFGSPHPGLKDLESINLDVTEKPIGSPHPGLKDLESINLNVTEKPIGSPHPGLKDLESINLNVTEKPIGSPHPGLKDLESINLDVTEKPIGSPHPGLKDLESINLNVTEKPIGKKRRQIKDWLKATAVMENNTCFKEHLHFPSVAALLVNLYSDDHDTEIISCPVAVLSTNWLLTTEECIKKKKAPYSVRINSNYWSKGGIIEAVPRIATYEGFAAIQLHRKIDRACLTPANISEGVAKTGQVFFWNADLDRPLKKKIKFEKIQRVEVKVEDSESRFRFEDGSDCGGLAGAPLFDQQENLIGFQLAACGGKEGAVPYRSVKQHLGWLQLLKNC